MNGSNGFLMDECDLDNPELAVGILATNTRSKGLPGQSATLALAFLTHKTLQWAAIQIKRNGLRLPDLADDLLKAIAKWLTREISWQELDGLRAQAYNVWRTMDMRADAGQTPAEKDDKIKQDILYLFWRAGSACVECDPGYQKEKTNERLVIFNERQIRNRGTADMENLICWHIADTLEEILGEDKDIWQKRIYDEVIFAPP